MPLNGTSSATSDSNPFKSPSKPKLIIHATNIHTGGGRVLLGSLLKSLPPMWQVLLIADVRMPLGNLSTRIEVRRVLPSLRARLAAEASLAREAMPDDRVLCFGNLPPLFRLAAHVTLFLQNRLLVERTAFKGVPPLVRLRLYLERQWLANRLKHCNEVLVQTATMANLYLHRFPSGPKPLIFPFMQERDELEPKILGRQSTSLKADFIYVASGEPHKNHLILLEAWRLLAADGVRPSLILTVDNRYVSLVTAIDQAIKNYGLRINNVGAVEHETVLELYRQARALVYPSALESFGIPLLEAYQVGLDILAPERDYVRDVVDPVESFDPNSPISIARAVRRYLGRPEPRHLPGSAADFLQAVLSL